MYSNVSPYWLIEVFMGSWKNSEFLLFCTEEQKEEDGIQTRPPGFSLFYLPFVDDKRVVPHMEFVDPGRSAVDAAVKIVKKVRLKGYSAEAFENPALQYHYRLVQPLTFYTPESQRCFIYASQGFGISALTQKSRKTPIWLFSKTLQSVFHYLWIAWTISF